MQRQYDINEPAGLERSIANCLCFQYYVGTQKSADDARGVKRNNDHSGFTRAPNDPEYSRPIVEVASELTQLAGHLTAGTYRWLALVAEFDARRGWAREGSRSCVDWLGWKCGAAANTAREQVRVANALPGLPRIEAAFARGEVSYSKVRAMTRVATPENEESLLTYARYGTASHLETLCRLVRRQDERAALDTHIAAHANRECRWRVENDGSVTLRASLPPELAATVVKALEAAESLLRHAAPQRSDDGACGPEGEAESRKSENSRPEDRGATEDWACASSSGPSSKTVHTREVRTIAARRADALVHVAESFLSGPNAETVRSDERYQVVVHVSAETLGSDEPAPVRASKADDAGSRCRGDQESDTHGEPDPCGCSGQTGAADERDLLDTTDCHVEGIAAIPRDTARRIACDASVVRMKVDDDGNPLDIGRRSRQLSPALQRALRARDRGCRFPGCGCERWVEAHHLTHWADGGSTSLDNLVGLCRYHHHLVHEAGYGLAFDTAGNTVATTPAGDVLRERAPAPTPGSTDDLFRGNEAAGASVAPDTIIPDWDGYAPDYSVTLQRLANRARDRRSALPENPPG